MGSRGYSGEEEKTMTPRRNAALGQGSAHAASLLFSGTCSPHAFTPGYRPPSPLPNSPILSVLTLFRRPPGCPTRCSPCVPMGMRGEGCGWFSCCLRGGDQLFLALFLNGVQQAHISACRSSCLDEYLPESLRYLAVSLQKGPAPFVW